MRGAPKDSQTFIDAKQFLGGSVTDMCGAIAAACGQLHASGYPNGATIDARGFTGTQVCFRQPYNDNHVECLRDRHKS